MKVTLNARRVSTLALAGLLTASFALAAHTKEQIALEKEGVQLIRQLEEVARDVRYNAGRLNSFTNTAQISRWTHAHHLEQIRSSINEGLKPALTRLDEIRPQLPEWKQQAIDSLMASARTLAADTNSAIVAKNEGLPTPPYLNPEYRKLIEQIYAHAETLVKTSDAAGTYAAARLKAAEAGVKVANK